MRGVSAVVTTGIYCRPDCSARPLPGNVRRFASAASAEAAGYRACLRCRPYRDGPPIGYAGSELVCRAVRLVLGGALDGATEGALARRLFVSDRHLRRLFREHLGITPDQLARSSRAHFARRLLDDTDLPISDLAFAAGFGSSRQLNRACREVFRAPPSELRERRRIGDRLIADGGLGLRLAFQPPLDWDGMFGYLADRAIEGVESVSDGVYRRTVAVDGDPGVLELSRGGPDHLRLVAHLPHWGGLIHVAERARSIFNLDWDVEAAAGHLVSDRLIGPLVRGRPGLRPPGTWDPFETGVRAIIGQQVSVAGAGTIIARVVKRHGTPVAGLGPLGLTHLFPSPAALDGADLAGLGMPSGRTQAIRRFARAVLEGAVDLDGAASLDRFVESVVVLPGLGPWTAQYLALRMGEADAFPASDLGIRRSLSNGTLVGPRVVEAAARRWRPWRALAAIHLWLGVPGASAAGSPEVESHAPSRRWR
jgi:AraC family transcriptional regulator, regulatory protein of adaptative response / DNA-3-methyladenine glycosylase II